MDIKEASNTNGPVASRDGTVNVQVVVHLKIIQDLEGISKEVDELSTINIEVIQGIYVDNVDLVTISNVVPT